MREGGGLLTTWLMIFADVIPANGFLPSAISMMLIPRAHTSLFKHASSSYTSGAMYHDVPQVVFLTEQECSN